MALNLASQNGFTWVQGAYTPTTTQQARPVLLGPQPTSGLYGGHAVGVDAPFDSPVYVRAYADPTRILTPGLGTLSAIGGRYPRLGYVGFIQAALLGTPVPPDVVGGDIRRVQPYSAGEDGEHTALLFMGPGDARARLPASEPPFFAYNAMTFTPVARVEDFGSFGRATGSLWLPRPGNVPDPVTGPSMLAQVNVPLVTEAEVRAMTARLQPLLVRTVDAGTAASVPLYRLVVEAIRAETGNRWVRDADRQLTLGDISRIRMAGMYMLLNVANGEHLEPVLCARLTDGQTQGQAVLTVHLLDYDHLRGAEELATLRLVHQGVDAWQDHGLQPTRPAPPSADRGQGGLYRPPIVLDDGAELLRIRLTGVVFAQGVRLRRARYIRGMMPFSGFQVDLVWKYDAETRIVVLDPTPAVRQIDGGADEFQQALAAFDDAYTAATPQTSTVDVSAFQLIGTGWAAPDPSQPRPARLADWEDAD